MSVFRFKKFEIIQEKSAAKVGTDGVLLGAWANVDNPKKILEIGAGTGLISLMLAQRFENAEITAIEIEKNAAEECKLNFENSDWHKRLTVLEFDFLKFNSNDKFDLIVSNPPFYEEKVKSNSEKRDFARQMQFLPLRKLIEKSSELLNENGSLCMILPFVQLDKLKEIFKIFELNLNENVYVKGNRHSAIKRILIKLEKIKTQPVEKELVIEISRHNNTEEFKILTQHFFLKF